MQGVFHCFGNLLEAFYISDKCSKKRSLYVFCNININSSYIYLSIYLSKYLILALLDIASCWLSPVRFMNSLLVFWRQACDMIEIFPVAMGYCRSSVIASNGCLSVPPLLFTAFWEEKKEHEKIDLLHVNHYIFSWIL